MGVKRQIYDSPFFSVLLSLLGKLYLKIWGWRIVGDCPDFKKVVVVAAPHTSNWDFLFFLAVTSINRLPLNFMAKHTLFTGRLGWLFHYLGGVPVNRSSASVVDVVDQVVQSFDARDAMQLCIAPEGTRRKVDRWKTGFYRIAVAAKVPIVLGFVDSGTKTTGFGPVFHPTGDIEADMAEIQKYYSQKIGVCPENQ